MLAGVDSEIKKYLQIDILLYEYVVSVFNSQLKEYGIWMRNLNNLIWFFDRERLLSMTKCLTHK